MGGAAVFLTACAVFSRNLRGGRHAVHNPVLWESAGWAVLAGGWGGAGHMAWTVGAPPCRNGCQTVCTALIAQALGHQWRKTIGRVHACPACSAPSGAACPQRTNAAVAPGKAKLPCWTRPRWQRGCEAELCTRPGLPMCCAAGIPPARADAPAQAQVRGDVPPAVSLLCHAGEDPWFVPAELRGRKQGARCWLTVCR
jgi:hypothetical protein